MSFALALLVVLLLAFSVRQPLRHPEQPDYKQLTFRQAYLTAARFVPDGQTIVYSAAWDHPTMKLYSSRLDGSDVRGLDLPSSDLLAVSRSGELAVALNGTTLARAPRTGGAPRELLGQVTGAEKRHIYSELRAFSILYVAKSLL